MITGWENDLMTRVEGEAPLARLMRENYWIPFALSENLVAGDAPTPVRLFGENFVAFRVEDGRVGFIDEYCPHRRASLALARVEGSGLRCIYHGWKMDVSGCVVETPTQVRRASEFAAAVTFAHFPVHEAGGVAWVWLGSVPAPPFPELPFDGLEDANLALTFTIVPCNWLQGLEGSLDSAHTTFLHQTWIAETARRFPSNLGLVLAEAPHYETEETPFGLRAIATRSTADGRTYVRVANFFFPLVTVAPSGILQPRNGAIFLLAPVDDTHHLLFFGPYGQVPQRTQKELACVRDDLEPDPRNFGELQGDRSNRWGQDRDLMRAGHFTGFGRSLLEEDVAVQASMGPIADRSRENLSSSDIAVAHARRLLLDAITAAAAGWLPPGTALGPEVPCIPDPVDVIVDTGRDWRQAQPVG
jgi:phthalate 4,5-dioxygenase oxygenase subunit